MSRRVVVIGAGWAGCAAAVELASRGVHVTLLEAARTLGGRARKVDIDGRTIDNGQHIMLGAYAATLKLMRKVGLKEPAALLKLPLQMRYAPGAGGMDFVAPRWPAPFHLLGALLRAGGLSRDDKLSLARFSTTARWMGWQFDTDCTVTELLQRFDQTPRLIALMWRPLCLAALNTPLERASANVFLAVLRDSLGASRAASDMLLPKADLSALLPDLAAQYVQGRGGAVHVGATATALLPQADGGWRVRASGAALGEGWEQRFDSVVLAPGALHSAALLDGLPDGMAAGLTTRLRAFAYEAITTVYLQYPVSVALDLPFMALIDTPRQGHWGQFVFDRGQLDARNAGLLAVVISASGEAAALGQAALTAAVAGQLAHVLRRPELAQPLWARSITEKRATFACAPALDRPGVATGMPGLFLAGDYTAGDYPATLEAAVRSGAAAATQLLNTLLKNKR